MRKGIADGEFRPVNPAHFVPSMVAMIVFYFSSAPMMQKIVGFNPLTRERIAEHQPQRIHQQMPFAAFDPFAGVIPHGAAVPRRLHTLTVQNRGRGPTALVVGSPHERAQRVVQGGPLVVERPLPEDMINGFPRGKGGGQIAPRAATFDAIEDGIQDAPPVGGRASAFGGFGEHRFEVSPLGIGEAGFVDGVFHAPTEAALKMSRRIRKRMSNHSSLFFHSSSSRPPASNNFPQNRLFRRTLRIVPPSIPPPKLKATFPAMTQLETIVFADSQRTPPPLCSRFTAPP